jgi:cell fate regulator YaaT (PSP1 superfamily)
MGCAGCATATDGSPKGCKSNGGCSTGGCNKLNTFDWISVMDIHDSVAFKFVEVSFKSGATKEFFKMPENVHAVTGDMVVVDDKGGYNVGQVSLSGELVRLQMKKKRVKEDRIMHEVIRLAHERDLEKVQEAREREHPVMVKARAIARTLGLEMKIGDVEYRADLRKATFYYTAEGRVDFRELVRSYAREFRVKVEMRQIGARQESGRIGGLGPCGRELCCSTWLTDFKSVSTSAARYQNLSINQAKLSGQCGRLKCCLNYELDTYMEALKDFPKRADKLYTQQGKAQKIKMDIFKRKIYYMLEDGRGRRQVIALDVDRVKDVLELNKKGEKPLTLADENAISDDAPEFDFESNVTGVVDLPKEKRKKRAKGRRKGRGRKGPRGKTKKDGGPKSNRKNKNSKNRNKGNKK